MLYFLKLLEKGGIPLGKVTELAGAAGVGKTNKFIKGSNYLNKVNILNVR
jgi:hypothetical protein